MFGPRVLLSRLRFWSDRARRDRELAEEIALHLDLLTEDDVRRGLSREEARLAAAANFGGVLRTTETYRQQRDLPLLDALCQDIRHAVRAMARRPGIVVIATLSIGLGVGVNVTT